MKNGKNIMLYEIYVPPKADILLEFSFKTENIVNPKEKSILFISYRNKRNRQNSFQESFMISKVKQKHIIHRKNATGNSGFLEITSHIGNISFNFTTIILSCNRWNSLRGNWDNDHCKAVGLVVEKYLHCTCSHFSIFSAYAFSPPTQTIDPDGGLHAKNSFGVVIFVLLVTVIYLIMMVIIWLQKRCRDDAAVQCNYEISIKRRWLGFNFDFLLQSIKIYGINDEFLEYYFDENDWKILKNNFE